jgi:AmmeMemoRadiSam system protein B
MALSRQCACSPGAASAALCFAEQKNLLPGRITGYYTSYDVHPSESFVGYGGVVF